MHLLYIIVQYINLNLLLLVLFSFFFTFSFCLFSRCVHGYIIAILFDTFNCIVPEKYFLREFILMKHDMAFCTCKILTTAEAMVKPAYLQWWIIPTWLPEMVSFISSLLPWSISLSHITRLLRYSSRVLTTSVSNSVQYSMKEASQICLPHVMLSTEAMSCHQVAYLIRVITEETVFVWLLSLSNMDLHLIKVLLCLEV